FIEGNLLELNRYIYYTCVEKPSFMKNLFSILILVFVINTAHFSQDLSQEDISLSESILTQKLYHIDLPTYNKAAIIVRRLITETDLSELEILAILDNMVASQASITRQFLERFHGLPVFINTGNPAEDQESYNALKMAWIENNPDKHQELINSNRPSK
ncbi:MAG: hypothetical protein P8L20_01270, partial [Flavobacteriales bacterium]|nr:hypothetical protein [Flavobacteriales bacterium]